MSYIKNKWNKRDKVTSEKLNNIENGIEELNNNISNEITSLNAYTKVKRNTSVIDITENVSIETTDTVTTVKLTLDNSNGEYDNKEFRFAPTDKITSADNLKITVSVEGKTIYNSVFNLGIKTESVISSGKTNLKISYPYRALTASKETGGTVSFGYSHSETSSSSGNRITVLVYFGQDLNYVSMKLESFF